MAKTITPKDIAGDISTAINDIHNKNSRGDSKFDDVNWTEAKHLGPKKPNEKRVYVESLKTTNEIQLLYENVLDASGLNIKNPVKSFMVNFHKTQKRPLVDPPRLGRTYIFVTRPDLNFSDFGNVQKNDLFAFMANTELGQRLMFNLMFPTSWKSDNKTFNYYNEDGNLIDRLRLGGELFSIESGYQLKTPFIPLFTNLTRSTSGAKDIMLDTMETDGDLHGNRVTYATGADDSFTVGSISLEMEDIFGSPILHLINLWVMYIYYYTKGRVNTRREYIKKRIIDYSCSIYIIMTELDCMTINRIVKYTGCFPKIIPLGSVQHTNDISAEAYRSFSLEFAYNRYEFIAPKIVADFNWINRPFVYKGFGMDMPEPLFNREKDLREYLNSHPEYMQPSWYNNMELGNSVNKLVIPRNKTIYDNQYFGTTPYIYENKLLWLSLDKKSDKSFAEQLTRMHEMSKLYASLPTSEDDISTGGADNTSGNTINRLNQLAGALRGNN